MMSVSGRVILLWLLALASFENLFLIWGPCMDSATHRKYLLDPLNLQKTLKVSPKDQVFVRRRQEVHATNPFHG